MRLVSKRLESEVNVPDGMRERWRLVHANPLLPAVRSPLMMFTRRILTAGTALALVLTACGGSDDETTETVVITETQPESTELFTENTDTESTGTESTEAATTVAPAETVPPETAPPATTPAETTPPDGGDTVPTTDGEIGAPAEGVAASLVEWAIEAPTEYVAGEVTFTATNDGNFPHEFVVIQGESYESLPLAEGGAVIEDDLPTGALLGRTARIGGGSSDELTVTLAPGNYVLLCNLGGGAQSHAGRGQRLDISVS